jgi:raffinose/stachyose/melibiose transport system permease protein
MQIYPVVWIFLSSFKSREEFAGRSPYLPPLNFVLTHYQNLINTKIVTYFKNSLIVLVVTLICIVILGALAAYPISKMEFKGRNIIKKFFMLGLMIPVFVSLIPMFRFYTQLGIANTYISLILPQIGFSIPMSVYMYLAFLEYLPNSLIESAYIDGVNSFGIFTHIILPLLGNTTVTIATFNFVFVWNEFVFANTFITSNLMKTIPIGLNDFIGTYGQRDWGLTFAAIFVTVLPTLLVFFFLNKQVMEGMTAGAVKE